MGNWASDDKGDNEPTRAEVAEYIHNMVGQLAEMARESDLAKAADALDGVMRLLTPEF